MRDGDIRRIQLLSESVKSKISAGEVVEGPFSVVKELVENSLDAGATRVEVHAGMSGLKRISVSDNGHGILRDDAALALRDHATSKIGDVHDIEGITTYGFRGEALSSISSISEVTLLTRHASEELGARVQGREGSVEFSDYAGPAGTTVIVENLFFNVPARKKFLKSPQTEMRYIRETFIKMALANPAVHFSLESDGKKTLNFPAAKDIRDRLRQVYGNEVYEGCYFEELADIRVRISGMLSKPDCLKASRTMQQLFINGRPVEYRYLGFLLSRAYEAVALHGKYPVGILFMEIDPALVDVNIHPAKREVKLFDGRYIDSLILQLANKALNRIHSMDSLPFSSAESVNERQSFHSATQFPHGPVFMERETLPPGEKSVTSGPPQTLFPHGGSASPLRDMGAVYSEVADHRDYEFLGVAFRTYIMAQKDDLLYLVDFHAAHERHIFDELMKRGPARESQDLMFPVVMELPAGDFGSIMDNLGIFSEIGFDIGEFSDNSITIRAVPAVMGRLDEKEFIREVLDSIKQERGHDGIQRALAASAACHSARRSGDSISRDEAVKILDRIFSGRQELRCPHGRPFVQTLKKDDIERIFKRQ